MQPNPKELPFGPVLAQVGSVEGEINVAIIGVLMLIGLATYLAGYRTLSAETHAVTRPDESMALQRGQWRVRQCSPALRLRIFPLPLLRPHVSRTARALG